MEAAGAFTRPKDPVILKSGDQATDQFGRFKFRHRYHLYSLRHTYASIQIELGMNAKRLQKRLGHSNIQLTLDTYGHLWPDSEADTEDAKQLDAHINRLKKAAAKAANAT